MNSWNRDLEEVSETHSVSGFALAREYGVGAMADEDPLEVALEEPQVANMISPTHNALSSLHDNDTSLKDSAHQDPLSVQDSARQQLQEDVEKTGAAGTREERFATFHSLYSSRDGALCLFEDESGHLIAVDTSKLV